MNKCFAVFSLALLLGMPGLPYLADTDGKMARMDEVVVTAGRLEEEKKDVTVSMTVITEEEIDKPSIQDLTDVLEEKGFQIRQYNNSSAAITIRGLRTDPHGNDLEGKVLLLVNGRRSATGNVRDIPLENVEKVEIIRGPGAVQYGSAAMGGVVNVITKKGKSKPSVFVDAGFGNWGYDKYSAGVSGAAGNFDFSFSASRESQDDDYETGNGETYYNTAFDSKDRVSLSAGLTFMPNNRLGMTVSKYEGKNIGSPGYFPGEPDDSLKEYVNSENTNFDFTYDGNTSDSRWLWNIRYFMTDREYANINPPPDSSTFRDSDLKGMQGQLTFDSKHIRITGGFDWTDYELATNDASGTRTTKFENPAAFLLLKGKLLDEKLILSTGVRYDDYDVTSYDGSSISDDNVTPSIGIAYKVISTVTLRANYAEGFKMATPDQLFGGGQWYAPAPTALRPETSETYEVGAGFLKGSISADITFFKTDAEDFLSASYDFASGKYVYSNIRAVELGGIEGSFSVDVGEFFDWSWEVRPHLSFTHLTKYWNEEDSADMLYTPDWTASYGLGISNADKGFAASLDFSYFSEQNVKDYGPPPDYASVVVAAESYTVANFSISKDIFSNETSGSLTLKGGIMNLFDKDYEPVKDYPAPGRSFNIGLRYVF